MLGANDGIVSVAGIVMGFAGATSDRHMILLGGMAGLVAGALSMAAGEYVSVSTQRDTERALIEKETRELADEPEEELAELADLYRAEGALATSSRGRWPASSPRRTRCGPTSTSSSASTPTS